MNAPGDLRLMWPWNKKSDVPGCLSEGLMSLITFRSLNSCSSFFPPNTNSCQPQKHAQKKADFIWHNNTSVQREATRQHTDVTVEDEGGVSMATGRRNANIQRNLPLHLRCRDTVWSIWWMTEWWTIIQSLICRLHTNTEFVDFIRHRRGTVLICAFATKQIDVLHRI